MSGFINWKVTGLAIAAVLALIAARQLDAQNLILKSLGQIRDLGLAGVLIFIALYIAACLFLVPGALLTLGAGAVYGLAKGTAIVSVSATLGAVCAFLAGRTLARGWVEKKIAAYPKFAAIDDAVAREGWKIVGLTRLSPVFPFNLLNYAYGVTKVSLRDYFFASWIGMLPGTVLYVYLGSLAGDLAAVGAASGASGAGALQWTLRGAGLAATVAVTVLITRIAKSALDQKVSRTGAGNER